MSKHHMVVLPEQGKPIKHQLKAWLRRNPQFFPPGTDANYGTSHRLRSGLQKMGWHLHIGSKEVLVIKPDETGSTSYATSLLDHSDDGEAEAPALDITDENQSPEITFGLERDLQSALRTNIEQLEPGLSIVDGGRERTTEAGRLDILAEDRDANLVVIELKAGRATSDVIAQTLSYMTAIAEEEGRPVRGAIVAGEFTDRVISAAKAVPNLDLFTYAYLFSFSPAA